MTSASATRTADFYPRPPRGGRPGACLRVILHPDISIHALREEGDRAYGLIYNEWFRFLSTPSARRATGRIDYETHRRNIFLSTPSARRATQQPERMGDRHQISIHALREEGDVEVSGSFPPARIFLSTPSARRATSRRAIRSLMGAYFYPRPPRGGRHSSPLLEVILAQFLSTPSARRATSRRAIRSLMGAYFYPRPPRGGRQSCPHSRLQRLGISIHALREEGDHLPRSWHLAAANFYPRPPRGGRPSRQTKMVSALRFLSTPSARRATRAFHSTVPGLRYFYPRPPRGGRQSCPHSRLQRLGISIHALREEGDLHPGDVDWPPVISIHALREEGDISSSAVFSAMGVFLSTPSARRATPEWRGMLRSGCNFYPRPPRGGRRRGVWLFSTCPHISIHALREEGDVCAIYDISELISFLSTPSARRATCCGPRGGDSGCYFYPRPPRGGRLNTYEQRLAATGFLSTPSARRATATATSLGYSVEISIHALREEGDRRRWAP